MIDPVQQARDDEANGRRPAVALHDIEIREDGHEYVSWVKPGLMNPPINDCRVARMPKYYADVWAVLEPAYKARKAGDTEPIDGTPLEAWPGMKKHILKALHDRKIRSMEQYAAMEDAAMSTIPIPGIRQNRDNARAYVVAKSTTSVMAEENVKLKSKVEFLEQELRDIRSMMVKKDEPAKKGGWPKGKPRKPQVDFNPDNDGTRVA